MSDSVKHYGANIFGNVDIQEMLSNIDKRGTVDGQMAVVLCKSREKAAMVLEARRQACKVPVSNIRGLDGPQIATVQTTTLLMRCARNLQSCSGSIDLRSVRNVIKPQVAVISNVDNNAIPMPSSLIKEYKVNISLWSGDRDKLSNLVRDVERSSPKDERPVYSDSANLHGYQDYSDTSALAKTVKLMKRDIEMLLPGQRTAITSRLRVSRGGMSRYTRLVIGFLYYIALETRGDNDAMCLSCYDPTVDRVKLYSAQSLSDASTYEDSAYIHCNRSRDQEYVNFLLIIAKEFPFANGLLERVNSDGKEEAFIPSTLRVPRESRGVFVMCDDDPSMPTSQDGYRYTADQWYSYLVNYAKSIHLEGSLDSAYCVAATICFPKLLPQIRLPSRKSQGEIFVRLHATKNKEEVIPNNFSTKEVVLGGFCLASSLCCVAKDIISNDILTSASSGSKRSIMPHINKDMSARARWYRYLSSQGIGDAVHVAEVIDALAIDMSSPQVRMFNTINPIPYWVISPLDVERPILHGFLDMIKSVPFDTPARHRAMMASSLPKTLCMFRLLEAGRGNMSKASSHPRSFTPNPTTASIFETRLQPGNISAVKAGVSVTKVRKEFLDRRGYARVFPPPEFSSDAFDDDDSDFSVYSSDSDDSYAVSEQSVLGCFTIGSDYRCDHSTTSPLPSKPIANSAKRVHVFVKPVYPSVVTYGEQIVNPKGKKQKKKGKDKSSKRHGTKENNRSLNKNEPVHTVRPELVVDKLPVMAQSVLEEMRLAGSVSSRGMRSGGSPTSDAGVANAISLIESYAGEELDPHMMGTLNDAGVSVGDAEFDADWEAHADNPDLMSDILGVPLLPIKDDPVSRGVPYTEVVPVGVEPSVVDSIKHLYGEDTAAANGAIQTLQRVRVNNANQDNALMKATSSLASTSISKKNAIKKACKKFEKIMLDKSGATTSLNERPDDIFGYAVEVYRSIDHNMCECTFLKKKKTQLAYIKEMDDEICMGCGSKLIEYWYKAPATHSWCISTAKVAAKGNTNYFWDLFRTSFFKRMMFSGSISPGWGSGKSGVRICSIKLYRDIIVAFGYGPGVSWGTKPGIKGDLRLMSDKDIMRWFNWRPNSEVKHEVSGEEDYIEFMRFFTNHKRLPNGYTSSRRVEY